MTIGIAWLRQTGDGEELWLASDSRLTGNGYVWDDCPKMLMLPRRDAVAAFSGSTQEAYPLLLQMANAIRAYGPAQSGVLEFFDLVGHLERVVNAMMSRLVSDPAVHGAVNARRAFGTSGDSVVVGGYSRASGGFVLRALTYDSANQNWRFAKVRGSRKTIGPNKTFKVFGDTRSRTVYSAMLAERLRAAGKLKRAGGFDFEPLESMWEFLQLPESSGAPVPTGCRPETTGGAPQVLRVLAGAEAAPFAVRWGDPSSEYILGRPCNPFENVDAPLITAAEPSSARMLEVVGPNNWTIADAG